MTVVDCPGEGRVRGQAHGEEVRETIRAALDRWRAGTSAPSRELVANTDLLSTALARVPDLVEEMRGIAEGAGIPFAEIVAYNFMDEQWWADRELGCSVLGRSTAGGVLLAQNMDLPDFMDGAQVVLRLRPADGPEALVLSSAGMIGLTGVNSAGVAVCVNTLEMLRHDAAGIAVAVAVRGALRQMSRADALAFLRDVPHASGQHYAVADPTGLAGVECSANQVVTSCQPGSDSLLHTNHPLANDDVDTGAVEELVRQGRIADSHRRLDHLHAQVDGIDDVSLAEKLLADRTAPLCVTPGPNRPMQTFGAVSYELGATPRARFCLGLPDRAPWLEPGWSS